MGNEIENGEINRCVPRMEIPATRERAPSVRVDVRPPLTKQQYDIINKAAHYNTGRFEVIDVLEDWKLNFNMGNAVKYISRAEHKGNKKQDLEKAIYYLKRELQLQSNT